MRRPSASGLDRARDHVNLRSVILAELAVGIRTGGVEVAQPDRPDAVRPLEVRQRMLDRELGLSVRVHRRGRMGFADRRLHRLAVHGAGRGEHELTAPLGRHRLERADRPGDVVPVVAGRIPDRVGHRQPRREVHHRRRPALANGAPHRRRRRRYLLR